MTMLVERLREQIKKAEQRYLAHQDEREEKRKEIAKFDAGRLAEVNLGVLEDSRRLSRRLAFSVTTNESLSPCQASVRVSSVPVTRSLLLERIIGTNELLNAAFLVEGARARRCVGRVVIRSSAGTSIGFGTGSMVSQNLLMTNNHVLDSIETASNSSIQFDFVELFDGSSMEIVEFVLEPQTFFVTDEELDCSLVAVTTTSQRGVPLASRGWVPLITESGKAIVGERVNIIQHPGGEPQQIAIEQNRIIDVVGDFLHYETDTQQGSSGSPVANRAWQTAALHHAGVPRRKDGKIMLINNLPWDGRQNTVSQIDWIANEGTRISSIVESLEIAKADMNSDEIELLTQVFDAPPRSREDAIPRQPETTNEPSDARRIDEQGRLIYTIPIEISVGIAGDGVTLPSISRMASVIPSGTPHAPPISLTPPSSIDPSLDQQDLKMAQAAVWSHESEVYYDAEADEADIEDYYEGIAERSTLVGRPLFEALHTLLAESHTTVFSYKKARLEHLYPWIDLHPDRKLRSIYSGDGFEPEEVIRLDLEVQALHESMLARFTSTEAGLSPEALERFLADLEAAAPFNCEHVVPQSWFGKQQPMKADLHNLFTCGSNCNSFRSNIPYFEFPPEDEAVRKKCGRRETNSRFEPAAGKGAVARATLYFLMRYVGFIGNVTTEMQSVRLPLLLRWHEAEAVSEYERHRNAAIRAVQGNRNPLIDFPEWAEHIDFATGFGVTE